MTQERPRAQAVSLRLGPLGDKQPFRLFVKTLVPLRYPERAQELFAKAEATAKAKYERLKKLVDFYNV